MAKREVPKPAEKDRADRWLLTYADLITLLLIFFIVLFVMSTQDVVKFQVMAESLIDAFKGTRSVVGESPGPAYVEGKSGVKVSGPGAKGREQLKMEFIKQEVERLAQKEGLTSQVSVRMEERGVVINILDKVLFRSGYADLNPDATRVLKAIGKILQVNKDQYMRVEGHTDNRPISNERFASNWELSAGRATNVVKMFIDEVGMNPRLLSEVGYGEFRPLAGNETEDGRAKNRRVEIVILSHKLSSAEAPALAY
jgi:chemotaxis protein MotB